MMLSGSLRAQDVTADEIVARHLAARGDVEHLAAVVYRNGIYHEGDFTSSGRAFMAMAKPFFKIVGDPADTASDFREGYDGSAWEWYRSPGIVVRTVGAANAAIRHNLDPEGPFLDYRMKGSRVERIPDATIGNRRTHGVRLVLRDGASSDVYFDATTFLVAAVRKAMPIHAFGEPIRTEERLGDYRRVNGVMFNFRSSEVEVATGKELNSMQWGAIEVKNELPRSWFSPPQFTRSALQEFLEQLFAERADTSALRWSYVAFRRGYPEIETRSGVEAIGYQMLKMGDHAGAIAVLAMNATDYPQASASAFALGRAWRTAGDVAHARAEFERALRLDPGNKRAADALASIDRRTP